jgi:hypothetical protein
MPQKQNSFEVKVAQAVSVVYRDFVTVT